MLVPFLLMTVVLVTFLFLVLYKGIWWWWIMKGGSIKASIWHSQDAFSWALAKAMSGWIHNHTGTLGMEFNPNNVGFIQSFRSVRGILAGVCLNFCCPRVYVCIAEWTIKDMHSTTIEPCIYMQALYLHIDVIMCPPTENTSQHSNSTNRLGKIFLNLDRGHFGLLEVKVSWK